MAIKVLLIAYARKFHYAMSFMLAPTMWWSVSGYSKLVYVVNRLNLCQCSELSPNELIREIVITMITYVNENYIIHANCWEGKYLALKVFDNIFCNFMMIVKIRRLKSITFMNKYIFFPVIPTYMSSEFMPIIKNTIWLLHPGSSRINLLINYQEYT